ncbi:MAG: HEPN domain-containing protein [Candidatus Atribacteria bacterium]|nr:HEPN domain-containing protein [Candidatus Atribacteria bacterium]
MKEITKEWLERAYDDIETMVEIIDNPHLTNIVALHSQQAIEKSLKAVIEEFEIGVIKTHNLEKLFATVDNFIQFEVDWDLIKKLDALYIDARYPSEWGLLSYGKPTVEAAKKFYKLAMEIYDVIKDFLESYPNEK